MRVVREPGVFWDVVDGRTVVCNPDRGALVTLNESARWLWDGLSDAATVGELVDRLAERFPDVPRATLQEDAHAFVDALRSRGIVTTGDG